MITTKEIRSVTDGNVHGSDGEKIGSVGQIYLDNNTGQPAWVTVKTGLFANKASFVPLAEATVEGQDLRVPYDKHKVKDAPNVDADGELTPQEEDELYRYYGVESGGQDGSDQRSNAEDRSHSGQDESSGRDVAGTAAAGGAAGGVAGHRAEHQEERAEHHGDERREETGHREGEQNAEQGEHGSEEKGAHRHEGGGGAEGGSGSEGGPHRRIRRYIVTEEVVTRREEELPEEGGQQGRSGDANR
ncbi:MAG: PRC-barrel domain-containing protein [Actinomycetota bacterium]|nr:PRC-barrel domain-containing protein [Actinomycetota bacterium]